VILEIRFRHLERNPLIENQIKKRSEYIKKHFNSKIDAVWGYSEIDTRAKRNLSHTHSLDNCLYNTLDFIINKTESKP